MKPLVLARVAAVLGGTTVGLLPAFQYAHVTGVDALAWIHIHSPMSSSALAIGRIATLAIAIVLATALLHVGRRGMNNRSVLIWGAAASVVALLITGVGSCAVVALRRAVDMREALQYRAVPTVLFLLIGVVVSQAVVLLCGGRLMSTAGSSRAPLLIAPILIVFAFLAGWGPFRWDIGEWHYLFALWAGDAACVLLLLAGLNAWTIDRQPHQSVFRWSTASIGGLVFLVVLLM